MFADLFLTTIVSGTGAVTALVKSKYRKFIMILIGTTILIGFFLVQI